MTNDRCPKDQTALLFIDPYNDFLSEGDKLWPMVEGVARSVGLLDKLRTIVAAIRQAGIQGIVFITGEPGIGKSALASRFLARAAQLHGGLLVGRGRCVEQSGAGEAYLPFLDAVGGLLSGM